MEMLGGTQKMKHHLLRVTNHVMKKVRLLKVKLWILLLHLLISRENFCLQKGETRRKKVEPRKQMMRLVG